MCLASALDPPQPAALITSPSLKMASLLLGTQQSPPIPLAHSPFRFLRYAENTGLYTDYPYYHRSNDLPEMLNFVQITLISQAITAAAATLAVPLQ